MRIFFVLVIAVVSLTCRQRVDDCSTELKYWSFRGVQKNIYDRIDSIQMCEGSAKLISSNRYALVEYRIESLLDSVMFDKNDDTIQKGGVVFLYRILAKESILYQGMQIQAYRLAVGERVSPDSGILHILVYARPYGVISFIPYESSERVLQKIDIVKNDLLINSIDVSPLLDSLDHYPEFYLPMP